MPIGRSSNGQCCFEKQHIATINDVVEVGTEGLNLRVPLLQLFCTHIKTDQAVHLVDGALHIRGKSCVELPLFAMILANLRSLGEQQKRNFELPILLMMSHISSPVWNILRQSRAFVLISFRNRMGP